MEGNGQEDDGGLSLKYCLAASLLKMYSMRKRVSDDNADNRNSFDQEMDLFLMQIMHQTSNNVQIKEMK